MDTQDGYSADGDANAESDSDSSQGDPEGRGLEAFEDVLSSWLTAAHSRTAHPVVKAQASLPLRPKLAGQSGGPSTLQRIQEQQQQIVQNEATEVRRDGTKNGQEAGAKVSAEQAAEAKLPAEAEDSSDSDEDESAGAGWTDVMSDWMTAAGVTAKAQQAQHIHHDAVPAGKAAPKKEVPGVPAAIPDWLADVSSGDDSDADRKASPKQQGSSSVQAPSTASLSEPKPVKYSSPREHSTPKPAEQAAQHAQQQSNSNLPPRPATSASADSPSPNPLLTEQTAAKDSSSSGVSSQDRKLDPNLVSRAKSDPPAFWPSPSQGHPPQGPNGNPGPTQLPVAASSVPPPHVYSADQGLAPQVSSTCGSSTLHTLFPVYSCVHLYKACP